MHDIWKFLAANGIEYERHDHPPVFTVEDVYRHTPSLKGAKTKNLFLRDKGGENHFLAVVPADKRLDLKAFSRITGTGKLSFASPERLKRLLGVEPGSVTLLAVVNDSEKRVRVFMDRELLYADYMQFHPLVNTSTLVMSGESVRDFLKAANCEARIIDIPVKNIDNIFPCPASKGAERPKLKHSE